ncbi:MAG: triose-phosphate isomerase [Thermoproteota archaeon]|nr:triose-phosphate isomerase [Thermoproteota archaeon]
MKRPLIINFKNYEEISAGNAVKLAESARQVAEKFLVEIVLAPPPPVLALIAKSVQMPVICQHVDDQKLGPSTGFVIPEIAKSYGVIGSLINHSEHRMEMSSIARLVKRLRKLDMVSIVCAQDTQEVVEISALEPNYIAIEPPELIGSGRAVSKENPAIITKSIQAVGSRSNIICGAGISDGDDVSRAMDLGSRGILVASGVIKAIPWEKKITELASGMKI